MPIVSEEWNKFQKQCAGSGLSRKEVSLLYRQTIRRNTQRGSGGDGGDESEITPTQTKQSFTDKLKSYGKKLADAGSFVVKHMDDIIDTSKEAKKLMDEMYVVDPQTGKKTLKTDEASIKKYKEFLSKVGTKYDKPENKTEPSNNIVLPQ